MISHQIYFWCKDTMFLEGISIYRVRKTKIVCQDFRHTFSCDIISLGCIHPDVAMRATFIDSSPAMNLVVYKDM